jgi:Uncharacterized protein conserved in bacteria (DUF2330)
MPNAAPSDQILSGGSMKTNMTWRPAAIVAGLMVVTGAPRGLGCCAVAAGGSHVVNADQTVIMLWDEARQTQHFIRKADFKTDAADVGFLVPSPSRPQLDESGNAAFAKLAEITAPPVRRGGGFPIGCSVAEPAVQNLSSVRVIEEKRVAGFDATVLTARSGDDLVVWLKANDYAYSPAVAEWAKPYLGGDWHFTALKIAKNQGATPQTDLKVAALRISFRTARPLFPYREPDSGNSRSALDAPDRLLRVYFIAEARYRGEIEGGRKWSGETVWSGDITPHRDELLRDLGLPGGTGPAKWWLTEFEDRWPYAKAAGDVYFSRAADQKEKSRTAAASEKPGDAVFIALLAAGCVLPLKRVWRGSFPRRHPR